MPFSDLVPATLAVVLAYLLGSIPFGLVLTRLFKAGDLRAIGSGNIGATNVLRTGRKDLAAATLLLDAAKGLVAVLVAERLAPGAGVAAAFAAFLGHIAPVWLKFRGGKGVATFLGALYALNWGVGLLSSAIWLAAAWLWRFSSLSALLASLAAPIALFVLGHETQAFVVAAMAALLWWKHGENIERLRAGSEPKIGQKS